MHATNQVRGQAESQFHIPHVVNEVSVIIVLHVRVWRSLIAELCLIALGRSVVQHILHLFKYVHQRLGFSHGFAIGKKRALEDVVRDFHPAFAPHCALEVEMDAVVNSRSRVLRHDVLEVVVFEDEARTHSVELIPCVTIPFGRRIENINVMSLVKVGDSLKSRASKCCVTRGVPGEGGAKVYLSRIRVGPRRPKGCPIFLVRCASRHIPDGTDRPPQLVAIFGCPGRNGRVCQGHVKRRKQEHVVCLAIALLHGNFARYVVV
mmetsp:Transcript_14684/g.32280  ORF Transcript_14684/g.32280 Transcript_14684/m.32280 type:complete len:263 (+) Transcript_14684:85-873(+)